MGIALPQLPQKKPAVRVAEALVAAFSTASCCTVPYRYWLFGNAFPLEICHKIIALSVMPAPAHDTLGKRDSHNELRRFFSPDMQDQFPVIADIAGAFQRPEVVKAIENLCDITLQGTYLRIEYCQDRDGFWLEPHMDIREKQVTIQIYLNEGEDADTLGTDIYHPDKSYFGTAPSRINQGMIFLPKEPDSFHGFSKRPIKEVRRSLIINYVTDDWRARHELCFPQTKVNDQ